MISPFVRHPAPLPWHQGFWRPARRLEGADRSGEGLRVHPGAAKAQVDGFAASSPVRVAEMCPAVVPRRFRERRHDPVSLRLFSRVELLVPVTPPRRRRAPLHGTNSRRGHRCAPCPRSSRPERPRFGSTQGTTLRSRRPLVSAISGLPVVKRGDERGQTRLASDDGPRRP